MKKTNAINYITATNCMTHLNSDNTMYVAHATRYVYGLTVNFYMRVSVNGADRVMLDADDETLFNLRDPFMHTFAGCTVNPHKFLREITLTNTLKLANALIDDYLTLRGIK